MKDRNEKFEYVEYIQRKGSCVVDRYVWKHSEFGRFLSDKLGVIFDEMDDDEKKRAAI